MTTCCSSSRSIVRRGLVSLLVVSALCAAAFVGGEGAGVPATSRGLDPAASVPGEHRDDALDRRRTLHGARQGACDQQDLERARGPGVPEGLARPPEGAGRTNIKGFTAQLGIDSPQDLEELAKSRITIAVTQFKMARAACRACPTVDLMLAVDLRGQQKTMEALLKMLEAACRRPVKRARSRKRPSAESRRG